MILEELIPSFKDNLKMKTTNPYFGTLILVWLYEHWQMFYQLFNFEPNTPTVCKINYLMIYLNPSAFTLNLLKCIGIAFGVLILSYFLINLSRFFINLYENKITPRVYEHSKPTRIIDIVEYEKVKELKTIVEKSLTENKDKYDKLLLDSNNADKAYKKEIDQLTNDKSALQVFSDELEKHLKIFEKEDLILYSIIKELDVKYDNENLLITGNNITNILIKYNIAEEFFELCKVIRGDNKFVNTKQCHKFMFLGLLRLNLDNFVEITDYGDTVANTIKLTQDFNRQLTTLKKLSQNDLPK